MSAPSIPAERFSFLPLLCEMLLKVQVGDTQELLRLVRFPPSPRRPAHMRQAQAIQERLASATEHVDSLSGSQLTADQQAELLAGLQLLLQRKRCRHRLPPPLTRLQCTSGFISGAASDPPLPGGRRHGRGAQRARDGHVLGQRRVR